MRIKRKASLLSLIFGAFGVHRFYLGERLKGAFYLFFGASAFFDFVESGSGFLGFMILIGVIDAILIMAMSQKTFDRRFNKGHSSVEEAQSTRHHRRQTRRTNRRVKPAVNPRRSVPQKTHSVRIKAKALISEGIALFKSYDYLEAIDKFNEALEIDPKNPNVHFNLACAYSLVEATDKAYMHLDKAVALGFDKFDKIESHDALAFIRTKEQFAIFKENGYRLNKQIKPPTSVLNTDSSASDTSQLLEELQKLAQKRRQGALSQAEFLEQKRMLIQK